MKIINAFEKMVLLIRPLLPLAIISKAPIVGRRARTPGKVPFPLKTIIPIRQKIKPTIPMYGFSL